MHWGFGVFGCSPISTFLHTFFAHFHHIYSFSRLIDMVIHFEGACYRTSYFPPHLPFPSQAHFLHGSRYWGQGVLHLLQWPATSYHSGWDG